MNISNNKYPALKLVSQWLTFIAWCTVLITIISALIFIFKEGFIFAIAIAVSGAFFSIIQFAIAESIIVLVDIEFNTRNSARNTLSDDEKIKVEKDEAFKLKKASTETSDSESNYYVEKVCRHGATLVETINNSDGSKWIFKSNKDGSLFEFDSFEELSKFANALSTR